MTWGFLVKLSRVPPLASARYRQRQTRILDLGFAIHSSHFTSESLKNRNRVEKNVVTQFSFRILPEELSGWETSSGTSSGGHTTCIRRVKRSSPRVRHGPRFDQNPMTMQRANTPARSAQSLPVIRIAYLDLFQPPTSKNSRHLHQPPDFSLVSRPILFPLTSVKQEVIWEFPSENIRGGRGR